MFNSLPLRTHSYAILKRHNFFFHSASAPQYRSQCPPWQWMLTAFWNAEIDGGLYKCINDIWFVLFALYFHTPSILITWSNVTKWSWKVHRHFTKFSHNFFWSFAILVLTSRFTGFTAVGTVLAFWFLCGLLFSST